jgi:hypothetical protein
MKLEEALDTFALRLYDWSLQDFIRELKSGCPILSLVGLNNRSVRGLLSWAKTLSSNECLELAVALVRRCHEYAAELKGEVILQRDKYWHQACYEGIAIHKDQLPPLPSVMAPTFCPVDPDDCLNVLSVSLNPIMGRISRSKSRIVTKKIVGDWKIETIFIFSRRDLDLRFEYQFVRKDGQPVREVGIRPYPRTLFLFYGVSETAVNVPAQADSEPMAKTISKLAEYFLWQANPLFDGIGIDD